MAYTVDNNVLVDGPVTQVDDAPRYPLGYKVTDKNGKEYVYVKATAALTAGTAVATAGRSALTVTSSSAFNGGFKASASTPTLATTGFDGNELVGTLVKITRSATVLGLFPITGAVYDGSAYVVYCPEVQTGDTVAFGAGANIVTAGGTASTKAGAINATPIVAIASGKYGFVAPNAPIIAA
jgi:hypothetical protein